MKSYFFLLVLLTLFVLGCQSSPPVSLPEVAKPDRAWKVGILVMEGVYNTELTAPMDIFQHTVFHTDPGMEVFTIAKSLAPIRTFEGLVFQPDYSYAGDSFPKIDVLVVPSAEHHLDSDLEDREMIDFVRRKGDAAQYVVSLCDGAFVLAQAGLLDGSESTTFPGDIATYRERFPQLTVHDGVLFVHDGKFLTSAGGAKSFEPALYLVELLYGKEAADGVARGMVIDWDWTAVPSVIVRPD